MKTLISIIIPTYNRAHLIGKTIESIQQQTYRDWECLIIDDGSTDKTESIIANYSKTDKRIQYHKKTNNFQKGPSAARNYGFEKSKGGYINWFDSDDLMHPKKLETDLEYIQKGDYDFTISQSEFFSKIGTPTKKYWNENLWSKNPINDFTIKKIGWSVNAPLWKKSSINPIDLRFDEALITADDFFYHLQALERNLKPVVVDKTLSFLRVHPERLNDYKLKSPFKLHVNRYLMKRKEELELSEKTIEHLNKQFKRQFLNLLKNKKTDIAKKYLKKDLLQLYDKETRAEVKRAYIFGVLYRHTGYGFRFLK